MYMKPCQKWDKQKPTPSTGEFLNHQQYVPNYISPPPLKDLQDTDGLLDCQSSIYFMVPVARFDGLGIGNL